MWPRHSQAQAPENGLSVRPMEYGSLIRGSSKCGAAKSSWWGLARASFAAPSRPTIINPPFSATYSRADIHNIRQPTTASTYCRLRVRAEIRERLRRIGVDLQLCSLVGDKHCNH